MKLSHSVWNSGTICCIDYGHHLFGCGLLPFWKVADIWIRDDLPSMLRPQQIKTLKAFNASVNWVIFSGDGLSIVLHQAIIWINAVLWIGPFKNIQWISYKNIKKIKPFFCKMQLIYFLELSVLNNNRNYRIASCYYMVVVYFRYETGVIIPSAANRCKLAQCVVPYGCTPMAFMYDIVAYIIQAPLEHIPQNMSTSLWSRNAMW